MYICQHVNLQWLGYFENITHMKFYFSMNRTHRKIYGHLPHEIRTPVAQETQTFIHIKYYTLKLGPKIISKKKNQKIFKSFEIII